MPVSASLRGDVTAMAERVAGRLHAAGAPHPAAGALALAARGRAGLERSEFAARLRLSPGRLAAIESGEVPIAELPAELDAHLPASADLDVIALCDLERTWHLDP